MAAVREPEFAAAERLLKQYAFNLRLRALDAIQIAVVLRLKSQGLVDQFVAADKVLCEVATRREYAWPLACPTRERQPWPARSRRFASHRFLEVLDFFLRDPEFG